MSEESMDAMAADESYSFPPFGEDLTDADGNPVVTWDFVNSLRLEYTDGVVTNSRPFTEDELAMVATKQAGNQASSNRDALLEKAATALTANATFLAVASPTNAQVVAQVKALTRQMNALIKLTLNDLNDIAGT